MLLPSCLLGLLTVLVLFPCFHCNLCTENPPSPYVCHFQDGSKIDISPLGLKDNKPRFSDIDGDYEYTYNPRYKFSIDDSDCKDAAACQSKSNPDSTTHYLIARQEVDSWTACNITDSGEQAHCINYKAVAESGGRVTVVELICGKGHDNEFKFVKEDPSKTYILSLKSKYVCPTKPGVLSTGSILCITFSVLVIVYLVVGILINRGRGAEGKELIPNFQIWSDFPALVKDGVLFCIKPCKKESDYDAI